jgi:hypothetical protein
VAGHAGRRARAAAPLQRPLADLQLGDAGFQALDGRLLAGEERLLAGDERQQVGAARGGQRLEVVRLHTRLYAPPRQYSPPEL